jgi:hypothetical protein
MVPAPQQDARRDSLNRAFAAGVRDARKLHHDRSAVRPLLLASVPAGALAGLTIKRDWAWPGVTLGMGVSATALAFRNSHEPVPAPPDSMRAKYEFGSDALWQEYRRGFEADIRHRREDEFIASLLVPLALFPIFAFAAAFRHSGH